MRMGTVLGENWLMMNECLSQRERECWLVSEPCEPQKWKY